MTEVKGPLSLNATAAAPPYGAQRRVILLFLDGVGVGPADPAVNPLAVAGVYPVLEHLLGGRLPTAATGRFSTADAELAPTDAQMGIAGRPQSATGQAAILTGIAAPQRLGEHFGPRPDDRVRAVVDEANLFARLAAQGKRFLFVNGYPERYFEVINRGKRRLSVVPYAATQAGQRLFTHHDVNAGRAMGADFTNAIWRSELGYSEAPLFSAEEAGRKLWELAEPYDLLFFEHWLTDVLGHAQDLPAAVRNFQLIDGVLGGLLAVADLAHTLILVTSDHGNVEDCSHGKHTENPALTLLLGDGRRAAAADIRSLADLAGVVEGYLRGIV
jgi:hypothetical protein